MRTADPVLAELRTMGNPADLAGMARFGINTNGAVGVRLTDLRTIARRLGRDHRLARDLWASGMHEARMLAALVDEPEKVTEAQMDRWVRAIDSWDVCDLSCDLFCRTPFANKKALAWSRRPEEFVKRAGFALMASVAWKNRAAPDAVFVPFLAACQREATDDRNFVKKAVNWAIRQIGKRTPRLRRRALATARRISKLDSRAARWIASDAIRELESEAVRKRLGVG